MFELARATAPVAKTQSSRIATVDMLRPSGSVAPGDEKKSTTLPIVNGTESDTLEAINRRVKASPIRRDSGRMSASNRRTAGNCDALPPASARRDVAISRIVVTTCEKALGLSFGVFGLSPVLAFSGVVSRSLVPDTRCAERVVWIERERDGVETENPAPTPALTRRPILWPLVVLLPDHGKHADVMAVRTEANRVVDAMPRCDAHPSM